MADVNKFGHYWDCMGCDINMKLVNQGWLRVLELEFVKLWIIMLLKK